MTLSNHLLANKAFLSRSARPTKNPTIAPGYPKKPGCSFRVTKTISQLPSIEGEREFTTESSESALQALYKVINTMAVNAERIPIH